MKLRAFCIGLAALVTLSSGCLPYRHHPCWGFRLHPCANGGGSCAPVCSSPIRSISSRLHAPSIVSDCATCIGGGVIPHQAAAIPLNGYPIGGIPSGGYQPVIGPAMPLNGGSTVIPSNQLHNPTPNPMPQKPGGQ